MLVAFIAEAAVDASVVLGGELADRAHELGERAHAELAHHARAMQLDRALADAEVHRDHLVRVPA